MNWPIEIDADLATNNRPFAVAGRFNVRFSLGRLKSDTPLQHVSKSAVFDRYLNLNLPDKEGRPPQSRLERWQQLVVEPVFCFSPKRQKTVSC